MKITCTFKGQEIEIEEEDCHTSLNFNGHYLLGIESDVERSGVFRSTVV